MPRRKCPCPGECGSCHHQCSNLDPKTPMPAKGTVCEPCYWGPRFDAMQRTKGTKIPQLNIK